MKMPVYKIVMQRQLSLGSNDFESCKIKKSCDGSAWDAFIGFVRASEQDVSPSKAHVLELIEFVQLNGDNLKARVIATNPNVPQFLKDSRSVRLSKIVRREVAARRIARMLNMVKEIFPRLNRFIGDAKLFRFIELFLEPLTQAP